MSALHANVETQTWQAVSVSKLHLPICFWHNAINHLATFYFNACLVVVNGGYCKRSYEQFHIYNKVFILSGIWKLHYEIYYETELIFMTRCNWYYLPKPMLTWMFFHVIILWNWISDALLFEQSWALFLTINGDKIEHEPYQDVV